MKINVFKTQCAIGTPVENNRGLKGEVIKISANGKMALVKFEDATVSWEEYSRIELCDD